MTTHRTTAIVPAALALAAALMLCTSAHAQRSSEPGMSGCPDGTKDGVLSAQPSPTPGGGCDSPVYRGDDRGGMRGIRPSAPKSDKSETDSKSSTKRKSTKE